MSVCSVCVSLRYSRWRQGQANKDVLTVANNAIIAGLGLGAAVKGLVTGLLEIGDICFH